MPTNFSSFAHAADIAAATNDLFSAISTLPSYAAVTNAAGAVATNVFPTLVTATNPTFSNAVLEVGLGIDTNSVAVLNEIAADFGGFPLSTGETATTVGGLLAALAAAVAWLRKKKIDKLTCAGVADITTENGSADVSTLFSSGNTSFNAENCRVSASDATSVKSYIDTTVGTIETALSEV